MKRLIVIFFLSITAACNRNPPPADVQANLKSAMINYLYSRVKYDSSKVKYHVVEDVIYYNDKAYYICDFKVKMSVAGRKDTTGLMRAYITKDFKVIKRDG